VDRQPVCGAAITVTIPTHRQSGSLTPKTSTSWALGRRPDVDVLVSGDGDPLDAAVDGLKVVRPAEFLAMLLASESQG
jgi:hypothetical protein